MSLRVTENMRDYNKTTSSFSMLLIVKAYDKVTSSDEEVKREVRTIEDQENLVVMVK